MVRHNVYPGDEAVFDEVYRMVVKQLQNDLKSASDNELKEEMMNAMRDSVYKRVYSAYTPTQYIRRAEKNGLADTSKYITKVYKYGGAVTTKLTLDFTDNGKDIVSIVENGTGYDWVNSEIYKMQPYPRQFVDEAIEDILNDRSALGALAEGLMRLGWSVDKPYVRKHTPQRNHKSPNLQRVLNRPDAWDGNF